ncbi:Ppx/GppA phosphatase family protein [Streptomyces sp. NPDC001480]|uniref:Ppx/GppA phosphatase family protein n=1 Tax=Streptomyces sp. NPDC001480 TaxID=3364577 RepID=UPI0036AD7846
MRQAGVLDVGCHSALLTVARRRAGGVLEPVLSRKVRLGLHQALDRKGRLREPGVRSVQRAVAEAVAADPQLRVAEVFAFATSVIRDAPNCDEVIARVARATGVRLRVLPGEEEARLAYVAARQWVGSGAGPLLVLDIGGGTVEIASGTSDQPRTVCSLPLGARRVTREQFPGGTTPSERRLGEVQRHLRRSLSAVPGLPQAEPDGNVLACSKTFTQLARLAAARTGTSRTPRRLTLPALRASIPLLADAGPARRGMLPGISPHRAEQSLAGALVAEALMEACGADSVTICPWSTREGLLLERLGTAPTG